MSALELIAGGMHASLAAAILAGAWAVGEAIGAVLRIDRVTPLPWRTEVKPVTRVQLAESDMLEGRRAASLRT